MVLSHIFALFRTVARSCVAVLFAFMLSSAPARAIPLPDSAGFARLERMAGPSGHARLRVQWRGQTFDIRKASYDSTGIHGGEREVATQSLSSVWSDLRDNTPVPWSEVERLRVPGSKGLPVGPIVGGTVSGMLGLSALAAAATDSQITVGQVVVVESAFIATGMLLGAIVSVINPFRKPAWVDF